MVSISQCETCRQIGLLPWQIPSAFHNTNCFHVACRGELGLTKSQMEMMKRELNSAKS